MFRLETGTRVYRTAAQARLWRLRECMDYKLQKPGFWVSALLTLMAVAVQGMLSMPLLVLDQVLVNIGWHGLRLTDQPVVSGIVNVLAFGAAISVGLAINRLPVSRAFPVAWPSMFQIAAMALTVLGADLLLSECDNLFRSVAKPPDWLIESYRKLLSAEGGLAGRIFLLVIVAPLTEELFFRGVILRGLLSRFPAWVAVGLSAFLFAAGHVNPWQFSSAFWIGIVFGWFYLRTRSLTLCILGHAFSNGLFVLFTSSPIDIPGLTTGSDWTSVVFQPWWVDVAGALMLALGIFCLKKATPTPLPLPDEPAVVPPPSLPPPLPPMIESPAPPPP